MVTSTKNYSSFYKKRFMGGGAVCLRFAVSGPLKCGFKCGLRFWDFLSAVSSVVCGFLTFGVSSFP